MQDLNMVFYDARNNEIFLYNPGFGLDEYFHKDSSTKRVKFSISVSAEKGAHLHFLSFIGKFETN